MNTGGARPRDQTSKYTRRNADQPRQGRTAPNRRYLVLFWFCPAPTANRLQRLLEIGIAAQPFGNAGFIRISGKEFNLGSALRAFRENREADFRCVRRAVLVVAYPVGSRGGDYITAVECCRLRATRNRCLDCSRGVVGRNVSANCGCHRSSLRL